MQITKRFILFFLLILAGGLILAGTALSWALEDQLGGIEGSEMLKDLYRFSQLEFWFAWAAALAAMLRPNTFWNAVEAGLLFAIVGYRSGDGLVAFENVDACRIMAENTASSSPYAKCTGGGVLSYLGVLLAWFVSLPEVHGRHILTPGGISVIVATVLVIIGVIVLFTSPPIKFNAPPQHCAISTRLTVFDWAMYSIWSAIFGFSGYLCDTISVLTTMTFFLVWVDITLFTNMFNLQSCLDKHDNSIWAGFILCWIGVMVMLFAMGYRVLTSGVAEITIHRTLSDGTKSATTTATSTTAPAVAD
jgi:hypothetical protein